MVLLTKLCSAAPVLDSTCFFKYPGRSAAFFFYGIGLATFINAYSLATNPIYSQDRLFKHRVEANRKTHSLLEKLRFDIDTRLQPAFVETEFRI